MSQDDWFDEEDNAFDIPPEDKKGKRAAKRRRPEPDDWEEDDHWNSDLTDPPY